jgi:hypothetical protein
MNVDRPATLLLSVPSGLHLGTGRGLFPSRLVPVELALHECRATHREGVSFWNTPPPRLTLPHGGFGSAELGLYRARIAQGLSAEPHGHHG